ncbi:MAG: transposase [Lachnospiraceae bacterium]
MYGKNTWKWQKTFGTRSETDGSYQLRKETIERIFGTAKEQHGFRYTQYVGKARMEMKAGLTFACMNLKKLAKILEKRGWNTARFLLILKKIKRKEVLKEKWCWA